MATRDDKELLELLTKLYDIQETIGAKPKSSLEDKRSRAESTATMGRGKKAKMTGSKFIELKSNVVDRLKNIHRLLEEEQARTRTGVSVVIGNNPKEIIARQAQLREEIRQAGDEWQELDTIYKNEARKRKSKFTREELDVQQTLVQRLYAEVEKVKELSSKNYARGGGAGTREDLAMQLNTQALNIYDLSGNGAEGESWTGNDEFGGGDGGGGGVELTHGQHQQLQLIDSRDQDFDKQLDEIGEGIQDLSEIAQVQNEEVRRQNVMLENVGNKIDNAHDHINNINKKMKETLDEVRGADKICVDIMCIVLMVGMGAVLYQLVKKNGF
jgi:hypothetical protein